MARRATFNTTFRCGNMLQVFENDLKTYNFVALIHNVALKIVSCNITFTGSSIFLESSCKLSRETPPLKNRR